MDTGRQNTKSKDSTESAESYTMRQATKILNVNAQRLRRYCRKGLVSGVRQPRLGQEYVFTVTQMDALRRAHFMTLAGFTVKDIRKYNRLAHDDSAHSVQERRSLLGTHKRQVWQQLEDLQQTIDFLERLDDELR